MTIIEPRDIPLKLDWPSKDGHWCDMAVDYLPFLEDRLHALNGQVSERYYALLNKDFDKLALSLMHCREKGKRLPFVQLHFDRVRQAIAKAESSQY